MTCSLQLCGETTGCWHTLRTQTPPHRGRSMLYATAWNTQRNFNNCHTKISVRSLGWNLIYKTYLGRSVWLCLKGFHSFLLTEYSQASPETQMAPSWYQRSFFEGYLLLQNRVSDSLSVSLSVVNPPNKKMWSGDTGVKECQDRPTGPCCGTLLQQGREGHRRMWAR